MAKIKTGSRGVTGNRQPTTNSQHPAPGYMKLTHKTQGKTLFFQTEWLNTIWLQASIKTNRIGSVNNISGTNHPHNHKPEFRIRIRNRFSSKCGWLRLRSPFHRLTQIFWQNACCFPHKYLYLPCLPDTHSTEGERNAGNRKDTCRVSYRGIFTCRRLQKHEPHAFDQHLFLVFVHKEKFIRE